MCHQFLIDPLFYNLDTTAFDALRQVKGTLFFLFLLPLNAVWKQLCLISKHRPLMGQGP